MSIGTNMRIPVSAKLFAGFGVILLMVAAMGWLSIARMGSIDQEAARIFEEDLEAIVALTTIEEEALQVEEFMSKGVLAALMAKEIEISNPAHSAELEAEADHLLDEANVEAEDVTSRIEALLASGLLTGELATILEEVEHNWGLFLLELEEVNADEDAGLQFAAGEAVLSGEGEIAFAALIEEIDEIDDALELQAQHSADAANSTYQSARSQMLIFIAVAIAVGAAVALYLAYLARSISNGANAIASGLKSISTGDLTAEVSITSNDELGDMATSFHDMSEYLREMSEAAEAIADGDLTVKVQPQSERDALGNAFVAMVKRLHESMSLVRGTAEALATQRMSSRSQRSRPRPPRSRWPRPPARWPRDPASRHRACKRPTTGSSNSTSPRSSSRSRRRPRSLRQPSAWPRAPRTLPAAPARLQRRRARARRPCSRPSTASPASRPPSTAHRSRSRGSASSRRRSARSWP